MQKRYEHIVVLSLSQERALDKLKFPEESIPEYIERIIKMHSEGRFPIENETRYPRGIYLVWVNRRDPRDAFVGEKVGKWSHRFNTHYLLTNRYHREDAERALADYLAIFEEGSPE